MMSERKERVIIEANDTRKHIIAEHFSKYSTNYTEWFCTKSEEIINEYIEEIQSLQIGSLKSLSELRNNEDVFSLLNGVDWDFSDNETTYLTHDVHPYPAKYIPQIPCNMISALTVPGELVWDPFGGSGTTALEALLLKRRCVSTDANPLALLIGQCKTLTINVHEQREIHLYRQWLQDISNTGIDNTTTKCEPAPEIPNIEKWFHENAVRELTFIKNSINRLSPNCKIVVQTALSRTVQKMSNQESETRYASKPRDVGAGETLRCFIGDIDIVFSKVLACGRLLQGKSAKFKTFDLRNSINENSDVVKENEIDLIVTSPPYANVTDYHLYHRFRMFWLGYDPVSFGKMEIGSHLRHQKEKTGFNDYMQEMVPCLQNCFKALKPGRYAVFVVGNSVFNGVTYDTANAYREEAIKLGFEHVGTISRNLPSNKRSFESAARRAIDEKIVILKKPARNMMITLNEAPYKLWSYEKDLLLRELSNISNIEPIKKSEKQWDIELSCYDIDKLRKLTFIHEFSSDTLIREATWQSLVENGDIKENIAQRKESKYVTHGIHEYKGKFYPQLCKSLLNLACVDSGAIILDPFMGSGTTILESYLNGYQANGCDMNPLAVRIAKAKIELLEIDPIIVQELLETLYASLNENDTYISNYLYEYLPKETHAELNSWFPIPVINKLGYIVEKINKIPDDRVINFLLITLSNIIREVSQQDPGDLRIRRRKVQLEDAPVIELYKSHLYSQMNKLKNYFNSRQYSPNQFLKQKIWEGDSRDIKAFNDHGLVESSVDAVITSPPYATALPYIDTNRLSLLSLFGMEGKSRDVIEENLIGSREIKKSGKNEIEDLIKAGNFSGIVSDYAIDLINKIYELNTTNEVGFRRQNMASLLYNYFSSMTKVLENINVLLKPSGSVFIVIGNNITSSSDVTLSIETTRMLKETANNLGWTVREEIPITVTGNNMKNMSNFIKENDILWFQKP